MTYFVFLQSEYDNESIAEDLRNGDEMSLRILGENDCSATPAHIGTDQFCWKYCPLLALDSTGRRNTLKTAYRQQECCRWSAGQGSTTATPRRL